MKFISALCIGLQLFQLTVSTPVDLTSCYNGGNWFIADDTDNTIYWQCLNGNWGNGPRKCGVGTCVVPNYGAKNADAGFVPSPCDMHCSNGLTLPFTTPSPIVDNNFFCNFDTLNNFCGLSIAASDSDYGFRQVGGATFVPGTGPADDHTYQGNVNLGNYVYAQAFDSDPSATTTLTTSAWSGTKPMLMTFFYHMFGPDIGSLSVYIRLESDNSLQLVWRKTGQQADEWKQARVALPGGISGGYKVVVEAKNGNGGPQGDIAVDDLYIFLDTAIPAVDCKSLNNDQNVADGWYKLRLTNGKEINTWCEMDQGRTVVQMRNFNAQGNAAFDKTYQEYTDGFGNPGSDFWVGLESMYQMTDSPGVNYKLVISLTDQAGAIYESTYDNVKILNAGTGYTLQLGSFAGGTGGDALLNSGYVNLNSNGMKFTTKDKDQDLAPLNCANEYSSGWWYNNCFAGNVNAPFVTTATCSGNCVSWKPLGNKSFTKTSMKLEQM